MATTQRERTELLLALDAIYLLRQQVGEDGEGGDVTITITEQGLWLLGWVAFFVCWAVCHIATVANK